MIRLAENSSLKAENAVDRLKPPERDSAASTNGVRERKNREKPRLNLISELRGGKTFPVIGQTR